MARAKGELSREVARRILSLKRGEEGWGAFAERIGLDPSVISHYKRREDPDGASLEAVADVLKSLPTLSGSWLLTGEPPRNLRPPDDIEATAEHMDTRLRVIGRIVNDEVDAQTLREIVRRGSRGKIGRAVVKKRRVKPTSEEPGT